MNRIILIFIVFLFSFVPTLSQIFVDDTEPLKLHDKDFSFFRNKHGIVGLTSGLNYPVFPSELNSAPTFASKNIKPNLLNGFNGLGFGVSFYLELSGEFPIANQILLGGLFSFTEWKVHNSCTCNEQLILSSSSLDIVSLGVNSRFFITNKSYLYGGLVLNFLGSNIEENSIRGNFELYKTDIRIGMDLGYGYQLFTLSDNILVNSVAKVHFINLILKKDNPDFLNVSYSVINHSGSTKEANIVVLSLGINVLIQTNPLEREIENY
jgi:hypothetical protein